MENDKYIDDFNGQEDELNEEDEVYVPTPKGIANLAAYDAGLIRSFDDRRFEVFWELFESRMTKYGYVANDDEDDEFEEGDSV